MVLTIGVKSGFSIYNVGSGYSLSIKQALDVIFKVSKIQKQVVSKNERRKNEVMDVVADISKIKKEPGTLHS